MRVKARKTQELVGCHPSCSGPTHFSEASQPTGSRARMGENGGNALNSQEKKLSSSSRLVAAGEGAS